MEHLTPKQAAQFLHDNPKALFIDCRSEMEFLFVGHPPAPRTSPGTTVRTGTSIRISSAK
jgi:rhodanese-related sulfurtransferase